MSRGGAGFRGTTYSSGGARRVKTRALLIVTAVVEVGAGIALLGMPSLAAEILLGEGLSGTPAMVLARIAGFALIALAAACWLGRKAERPAQSGLVAAMLIYNLAVPIVLGHARMALALEGPAFWPACLLHTALAFWCAVCLRPIKQESPGS